MKTKYVLIILLAFAITDAKAQEKSFLDTIKISVDSKVFISIATFSYKDLLIDSAIFKDISLFQTAISKAKSETSEYKTYKIEFLPGRSMVIKEGENKKSYYVKDGVIKPNIFTSECFISGDDYKMYIDFADINDLEKVNLEEKVKQTISQMPKKDRIASTYNYSFKDTTITHHREMDKKNGALDVLAINIGIGAGIIKNQPLNDFTGTIGIILPKNGISKYNFYVSVREFITFDNSNNALESSFINAGFRANASNNINRFNWLGIEVGYNLVNESNLFGKNAFVFGFVKEFGKFSLTSQCYFSDKLSNAYYGLRFGFDW